MKKGKLIVTITIGIVCFLLTMVIFMQFKVVQETKETDVDLMKEADLRTELASWKQKYEQTKQKYDETKQMLSSYKEDSANDTKMKQTLEDELSQLELALGQTDVEGEGAIITLSEKNTQELAEEENVISVSAVDLIYIVNYLKDAGAEAISINDERIINSTDIADVGDSIKINSRYLRTDTYVIKAIGNSSYIESSIFGKGGYAEQLDTTGIKANIERQNKVQISKYTGEISAKYIKEEE